MQNSTPNAGNADSLAYAADMVRATQRDWFLLAMFVPQPHRDAFIALYGFHAEIKHVRASVSEEITAHMRYAWWQERLEDMRSGKPPRRHPVLELLAPLVAAGQVSADSLLELVQLHRSHYPERPQDDALLDKASLYLLRKLCPNEEEKWSRARETIRRHRVRHGEAMQPWLLVKLLCLCQLKTV